MTEGLQGYMNFAVGDSLFAVPPTYSFYGRPCARFFVARESTLIHSLIYISDVLGYTIGDVRYTDYLIFEVKEMIKPWGEIKGPH